jgi:hypothetical protein
LHELKELFYINHDKSKTASPVLLVHAGDSHFSFALTDPFGRDLYELAYCSFRSWDEWTHPGFLSKYSSLQENYPAHIVVCTKKAALTPLLETAAVNVLAGQQFGPCESTDTNIVEGWQNQIIYNLPPEFKNWILQRTTPVKTCHQFSIDLKEATGAGETGIFRVDFGENYFTLTAAKNNRVLLCRHFPYTTPVDVLYYLLWTCGQFNLSQDTLQLEVSGLVDPASSLIKELQSYFVHLSFRTARWGGGGSEYPAHFFTVLNDAIACE